MKGFHLMEKLKENVYQIACGRHPYQHASVYVSTRDFVCACACVHTYVSVCMCECVHVCVYKFIIHCVVSISATGLPSTSTMPFTVSESTTAIDIVSAVSHTMSSTLSPAVSDIITSTIASKETKVDCRIWECIK